MKKYKETIKFFLTLAVGVVGIIWMFYGLFVNDNIQILFGISILLFFNILRQDNEIEELKKEIHEKSPEFIISTMGFSEEDIKKLRNEQDLL
ncbi:MAG TPA: hypothetical protein ENH19_02050 [Actinobacteria bacterium]|nr:hypothetical protein [Actinomycetes bacterium]HEX21419.1 hypothetical protein [Actinomycetota bacterium]